MCHNAIDAGERDVVLDRIDAFARDTPLGRAAVRGAATGYEAHWHDALAIAAAHGIRPVAVDALEGLAVAAPEAGTSTLPFDCTARPSAFARRPDTGGGIATSRTASTRWSRASC